MPNMHIASSYNGGSITIRKIVEKPIKLDSNFILNYKAKYQ
jgi:hypothetical protein